MYGRAAIALESIRRALRAARFDAALFRYASGQRFRHPTSDSSPQRSTPCTARASAASTLRPLLFAGETSAVHLASARKVTEGGRTRVHVRARRTGAVALPTWLAAYDAQGRELQRIAWPSGTRSLYATFDGAHAITRLALDPDRALLVDSDVRDQIIDWAERKAPSLLARAVSVLALVLSWVGP